MMSGSMKRRPWLAAVAAVALAIVGCGGDDDSSRSAAPSSDGPLKARIGVIQNSDYAPIVIAEEHGIFRKHGLEMKLDFVPSSTALIPALIRGDIQFLTGSPLNFIPTQAEGVGKFVFVTAVSISEETDKPAIGYLVGADSPIKDPRDLGGTSACLPSAGSASQGIIQSWVYEAGGDWKSMKFVVAPFPTMVEAIESGKCDGAFLPSPFFASGLKRGLRNIGNPQDVFGPPGQGKPLAMIATTPRYVDENPDVVERFISSMEEATRYSFDHPEAVRAVIPGFTGLTPEAVKEAPLGVYTSTIFVKSLQRFADLPARVGYLPKPIDVTEMIAPGAPTEDR